MPTVSIRQLAQGASRVVADVQSSGRPAIVTNNGRPCAALVPLSEADLEDFVLANAPELVAGRHAADRELADGRTRSLSDALADLDDEG